MIVMSGLLVIILMGTMLAAVMMDLLVMDTTVLVWKMYCVYIGILIYTLNAHAGNICL